MVKSFKNIKRYNAPTNSDIVVCISIFNIGEFTRPIMNNLYVINLLEKSNIPYYIIELTYQDQEPTLPSKDNIFHVKSNSILFHKENLLNLLVSKLPKQYTKVVCMDGDVVFKNLDWINEVSKKLEECDILIPYHDSYSLDSSYKRTIGSGITLVDNKSNYPNGLYTSGYAISFKREFFDKIGLFEYAIVGGGDRMTLSQFVKRPIMINEFNSSKKLDYINKIKELNFKFDYLFNEVYHLYHGKNEDRRYLERHFLMNDLELEKDLIKNEYGVLEFTNPSKYNPITYSYFKNREEDL